MNSCTTGPLYYVCTHDLCVCLHISLNLFVQPILSGKRQGRFQQSGASRLQGGGKKGKVILPKGLGRTQGGCISQSAKQKGREANKVTMTMCSSSPPFPTDFLYVSLIIQTHWKGVTNHPIHWKCVHAQYIIPSYKGHCLST